MSIAASEAEVFVMRSTSYDRDEAPESQLTDNPTRQAYELLHWGFVAAPAIAGLDKFTHVLVDWDKYLAPAFAKAIPLAPHTAMMVVGVVEIAAALLVALKPRIGGYVVAVWLAAIILNLLVSGLYLDIALRDFGLILAALALQRLAVAHERGDDVRTT
jgi:hypothetical protein